MASEQGLPTSDIRAAHQDYKRDAEHKHKWAHGTLSTRGRGLDGRPRPMRVSDRGCVLSNQTRIHDAQKDHHVGKAKLARKYEMLSAGDDYNISTSDDSSTSAEEDVDAEATPPNAQVMYSFDAARAPSQGSQILNAALAKAIDKYEDKQTTKLVQTEYEVLDPYADDQDSLGLTPAKSKETARIFDIEDEDYEFL